MPLVTYSALRLGLLAACLALGYWAGLRTWLLLVIATFAAWGLSYVLLGGPRDAAARYVAERVDRRGGPTPRRPRARDADAALEDALVDEAERDARAGRGGTVGRAGATDREVTDQQGTDRVGGDRDATGRDRTAEGGTDAGGGPRTGGYPGETARPSPNSTP